MTPDESDRQDRADLAHYSEAAGLEVRRTIRTEIADDVVQHVSIGPAPTASTTRPVLLLVVAVLAAIGFAVAYVVDGTRVIIGLFLGVAFLSVGAALVVWASRLMPEALAIEQREPLDDGDDVAVGADFSRPELEQPGRRTLLVLLTAAGAAIAGALVFPFRSLGPAPAGALSTTSWRAGSRVVDGQGRPVHRDDIPLDGSLTVFPEGHVGSGDSQVMLVRVPPETLSEKTVAGGVVDGRVAYSKVCSHAGCPVGQFRVDSRPPVVSYELLCPCHQSLFDVTDACRVLAGPAGTPLPQLPLDTDADGYLVASGDFPVPIGPSYWNRS